VKAGASCMAASLKYFAGYYAIVTVLLRAMDVHNLLSKTV